MADNQWPEFNLNDQPPTVRSILLEEGEGVRERTDGRVRFDVETTTRNASVLVHDCYLVAPRLGYRYPFLKVTHGLEQFPVTVVADPLAQPVSVRDEVELRKVLGQVFRSEATKKVVLQLLAAQS